MSKQSMSPMTLTGGEDLVAFRRVKISSSTVVYADAADHGIGVVQNTVDISEDAAASIRLDNAGGSSKMMASGAISAGVTCYAAADGKVASSGTIPIGTTVGDASTADGDIIEVMPLADMTANMSDLNVLLSDVLFVASDLVFSASDTVTNKSDIVVIKSDLLFTASDTVTNKSDIVVIKSDITVGSSDVTTQLSNLRVAASDALVANAAGDTANVSDLVVTINEFLVAFSDALG